MNRGTFAVAMLVLLTNLIPSSSLTFIAPVAAQEGLGSGPKIPAQTPRLRTGDQLDTSSFDATSFFRTFSHRTAEVNGVKLHYIIGGKGEPVVLLHGWPTTWYEWRRMMPLLAKQYTVIVPDLRGLGDSDKPSNSGNKQITAEDIYQLCRKLGYDRIFLVGHDWGTSVAYVMAQEHPELIRRLVLSDNTIPGLDLPNVMTFLQLNNIPYHHNFHAEPDTPEALISGKERFYLTNFYKKLTYNWATFTPDFIDEFVGAYSQPGALRAGFGFYRAIAEDDRYIRRYNGRKLQMPVLVVTGDHATNEYLHLQLRPVTTNYRGYVMERTGHFLPIERPREFTQLILEFFDQKK